MDDLVFSSFTTLHTNITKFSCRLIVSQIDIVWLVEILVRNYIYNFDIICFQCIKTVFHQESISAWQELNHKKKL